MVSREALVTSASGLHLRPAGNLCKISMKFASNITIEYKNVNINAKSVLNIMASGVPSGATVNVICDGPDEEEALDKVCEAIESGLGGAN